MDWFGGKVSLGNFPDISEAVNKLSESVKSIEKNFDSALGIEEKSHPGIEASGVWQVMSLAGPNNEVDAVKNKDGQASQSVSTMDEENILLGSPPKQASFNQGKETPKEEDYGHSVNPNVSEASDLIPPCVTEEPAGEPPFSDTKSSEKVTESVKDIEAVYIESGNVTANPSISENSDLLQTEVDSVGNCEQPELSAASSNESYSLSGLENPEEQEKQLGVPMPVEFPFPVDISAETDQAAESSVSHILESTNPEAASNINAHALLDHTSNVTTKMHDELVPSNDTDLKRIADEIVADEKQPTFGSNSLNSTNSSVEIDTLKGELKTMENALQGAAKQAKAKADEIAKLLIENESLKAAIEDMKNSSTAEINSLKEEYHQRTAALERKVYTLTKERDALRREQNKKSDAAALIKEKDEIINQVMAEGEELSKKQAVQETTIRKLRTQIRELEEEKKGVLAKLQVEENELEVVKREKTATEKLLQDVTEKHQAELAAQKEYYNNALTTAKEAEALAGERAHIEARNELETRLREASDRENFLVQALEELRQTLSKKEQQAVFREDMLHRDIEDLQKRYQESERRYEELITQVPESTRPLLRQIEAMQETLSRRTEAWSAVEKSLSARLQEAETKASCAEEKERLLNERLSQSQSKINVLEAQITCLRAEQMQLSRSLEKERLRAAENRQEYLMVKEEAESQGVRVKQLENFLKELKQKHKQDLLDAQMLKEQLQQEIEREKAARLNLETLAHRPTKSLSDHSARNSYSLENGKVDDMEESYFLKASLDIPNSPSNKRDIERENRNSFFVRNMMPNVFEVTLRQKEGELSSYMSRLASMEFIRDSLTEELVKMTAECEKLQAESSLIPGIQAELDALKQRHAAALELMGERDEELEELRADIVDLKEMYREQVDMLVNKIETLSASMIKVK